MSITRAFPTLILAFALVSLGLTGCDATTAHLDAPAAAQATEVADGYNGDYAAYDAFYLAQIAPVGDSRMRGTVQIRIEDGYFRAKVRATGAERGATVPQHIHVGSTCDAAGGVFIAFDDQLRVPGEDGFAAGGDNYPTANRGGVVQYEAERPLADLLDALGADYNSLDDLDLDNRVFNLHVPGIVPVIGCGPLQRIN